MALKQKIPKWLELDEGESLLHTYLLNETNILVLLVLLIVGGVAAVFCGLVKQQWATYSYVTGMVFGVFSILTFLRGQIAIEHPGKKVHLTSSRVIVEERQKPKWVGKLEEVKAIEIKKKIIGGIVRILFENPSDPVISAYSIFPVAMATEIQAACANAKEHNVVENNLKGESR